MSEENLQKLSDDLTEFAINTLSGQFSGAYKIAIESKNVSILKNFKNIYPVLSAQYLNTLYSSLIRNDDLYVTETFKKFKNHCSHSEVCLLHIIRMLCDSILELFDFEKCNFSSYQLFMTTCTMQLNMIGNTSKEMLPNCLSHKCTGIDISTCDPNEKLFDVKITKNEKVDN